MQVGENAFNEVVSNAARYIHSLDNKDKVIRPLQESGLDMNWEILKAFAKMGASSAEGTLIDRSNAAPIENVETIRKEIIAKKADKVFMLALNDAGHADHAAAIAQWQVLQTKLVKYLS